MYKFIFRIIAGYFAELAREYAPKQIWALVGGFLLLRYINPALMTPETYELLPEGKLPSSKARRNLILITKVIQVMQYIFFLLISFLLQN